MSHIAEVALIEQKIAKHQAFWSGRKVDRPVVGVFLGSWTSFKDNHGGDNLWELDTVRAQDVHPERFIEDYETLFASEDAIGDDLIRAAQPFPSIPWMEAIVGCPVRCSRPNIWAATLADDPADIGRITFDPGNGWVEKYIEFLELYGNHFGRRRPICASILRGPADVLAALLGDERAVYAYLDQPEATQAILDDIAELFRQFVAYQWRHTPEFYGGYMLPQNELWTPQPALRMQEDASALISPEMYRQFLLSGDVTMAAAAAYSVFHLHTTSFHLLGDILDEVPARVIQVSKDDGYQDVEVMLSQLLRIQACGRRLILRGRFTVREIECLRRALCPIGLCIHTVVETTGQASEHLDLLRQPWQVEMQQ